MLNHWNPSFINEILKDISPEEHALVEFYLEYLDKDTNLHVALRVIKTKFPHFETLKEYDDAVALALSHMREQFEAKGITSIQYLDFADKDRTLEGRMQKKIKLKRVAAATEPES